MDRLALGKDAASLGTSGQVKRFSSFYWFPDETYYLACFLSMTLSKVWNQLIIDSPFNAFWEGASHPARCTPEIP